MILALDIASLVTALAAAWFWYLASGKSIRRLQRTEEIDYHDFNRLVVAFNRTQQLNARAALITAVSALCVAARFAAGLLQG
ncbi:MAG: hypothetical protein ACT4OU_06220 [Hyphomicrobium sp.]